MIIDNWIEDDVAIRTVGKNLIGNGRGLLSGRTGELLTQTLSSELLNCRCMAVT